MQGGRRQWEPVAGLGGGEAAGRQEHRVGVELRRKGRGGLLASSAAVAIVVASIAAPAFAGGVAPGQPEEGPGGSDYTHPDAPLVSGQGGVGGWTIYEPNPRPSGPVPVVIVMPGNCLNESGCNVDDFTDVGAYSRVMEHFAMKGNIAVYTRYQADEEVPAYDEQSTSALASVVGALEALATDGTTTTPDLDNVGIWAHSRGAWLAPSVAARMQGSGAPAPRWLLSIAPTSAASGIPAEDWSTIPPEMLLLVVTGEHDTITGSQTDRYGAPDVFEGATSVPLNRKDFVHVRSDLSGVTEPDPVFPGQTVLLADHNYPGRRPTDALDFFASYKLGDALRDCTYLGEFCEYALGDTPEQRSMGIWSDGTPVNEMCVTDDPRQSLADACQHEPTGAPDSAGTAPEADGADPEGVGPATSPNLDAGDTTAPTIPATGSPTQAVLAGALALLVAGGGILSRTRKVAR